MGGRWGGERRRGKEGREKKLKLMFKPSFIMFNIESFREQEEQEDTLPSTDHCHPPRMKIWSPGGGFM